MSTVLFNLENVDVVYQDLIALHQVNLKIRSGEKIALVGPSGAGKTTLLHQLFQLRPLECSLIQQHFAHVPQLSVFHNIYMEPLDHYSSPCALQNLVMPRKNLIKKIRPILKAIGMEKKLFTKVEELSGDQQQRVAVGRAIFRDRDILLADEPVAAMEPLERDEILKLIVNTGHTVVMALHPVEFTLKYAQRVVGLYAGEIKFDLPASQVTSDHIIDLYLSC